MTDHVESVGSALDVAAAKPKDLTKSKSKKTPVISPELEAKRKADRKMVKGKFIFHESPGGSMAFPFKAYHSDPLEKYEMTDGQIYTVPLGVAKHLNTNCSYPSYKYQGDETGRPVMTMAENIRRCSFQSLEFLEDLK